MPRQAADLEEALNKKGGLTLSQLANYDDLITDALVDRVYYWSTIRKLKANYHACRGVQQEDLKDILQKNVVVQKDPQAAHKRMLELSGIAAYYKRLKTVDEKEHFERHLRKYINIYLPDCPFEVDTTNRYTIMTAEACIKARKPIKKGETIKYLSGIQVEMTEKEEKELSSRTDFSIVLSSRRKRPSLFLGPARFANHDCDSNARLNTTGPHGIHIVACKDIAVSEEITVRYGEDYFGIDNCECLCSTCESHLRNGWDPRGPPLNEDSSDDDEDEEEAKQSARPCRVPKADSESRSPPTLGKRKRGTDTHLSSQEDGPSLPRKRGRGRPRKYPRPDEDKETDSPYPNTPKQRQTVEQGSGVGRNGAEMDVDESLDDLDESIRDGRGRFLPRGQDAIVSDPQPQKPTRFFGRFAQSFSRDRSETPPRDALLEKLFNLLTSIGERKERESRAGTPKRAHVVESEDDAETESEIRVEARSDAAQKSRSSADQSMAHSQSHSATVSSSPAYAKGLSRSPSLETMTPKQRTEKLGNPKREVVQGKLPMIKKERSVSSLRNVINAEDEERTVFTTMASKAQSALPKRRRARLSKEREPEDFAESSDSSSPSSNNDSSSATSQTSSMTSFESFAAGNIASSICQMLTTEQDDMASAEQTGAGPAQVTQDIMDADDEIEPTESRRWRGRQALRKSPRKTVAETSTPPLQSIERNEPEESSEDEEKRGPARTPNDYTLCEALLSTTYHRWVECRNCDEFFVQDNAYQTRIGCPRCERHSRIYGYAWPKTDKEGKFDKEERLLDHRAIHRFIDPEEERNERKGRKTLAVVLRERELSSRQESEESDRVEKRLRNSPRRSESRRKMRMTM